MLISLLLLVGAYLLGSLSGSLLLGRWRGVDVRRHGSGNAGGTNALRTLGWKFALGVVLIDVGKGAVATWLALRFAPPDAPVDALALAWSAALLAIAGHTWPLFYGFRGGKGAATLLGALAVIWPWSLPWFLGVWLIIIGVSGYVGLATILATLGLIVVAALAGNAMQSGFAVGTAALIVYNHRDNIRRLLAGNEARFERARILLRPLRSRR
ncbi:MAG: acyl-phosphate glycerol 3-phosphate acyltransferase [Lysobacterales bacterium CG17_big_fil_post_rev_8_21_14_2_50_64_11]|nr:MAG: acyl-phosphate glycerol 3-phosphate acyltransferase [Xanthomonadales bacterium CG17_big_fil_post_rev_8_21_14_2_50_64_11]PIX61558.1 MAG: acyl-phosphate glycerol 3-phosphate acyltransferase [Xanthomonadales bacterium CG_4_10_14_3_um_filter_64_11]